MCQLICNFLKYEYVIVYGIKMRVELRSNKCPLRETVLETVTLRYSIMMIVTIKFICLEYHL